MGRGKASSSHFGSTFLSVRAGPKRVMGHRVCRLPHRSTHYGQYLRALSLRSSMPLPTSSDLYGMHFALTSVYATTRDSLVCLAKTHMCCLCMHARQEKSLSRMQRLPQAMPGYLDTGPGATTPGSRFQGNESDHLSALLPGCPSNGGSAARTGYGARGTGNNN